MCAFGFYSLKVKKYLTFKALYRKNNTLSEYYNRMYEM